MSKCGQINWCPYYTAQRILSWCQSVCHGHRHSPNHSWSTLWTSRAYQISVDKTENRLPITKHFPCTYAIRQFQIRQCVCACVYLCWRRILNDDDKILIINRSFGQCICVMRRAWAAFKRSLMSSTINLLIWPLRRYVRSEPFFHRKLNLYSIRFRTRNGRNANW